MWELAHKEGWSPKNWRFWTVVLEKTLESPLNCKEIQPVYPEGDLSWVFIGRTDAEAEAPILWPPDVKSLLIGKDPIVGKDWGQEEKGMIGWGGWMASLLSMDMNLIKQWEMVKDRRAWRATESWTWLTEQQEQRGGIGLFILARTSITWSLDKQTATSRKIFLISKEEQQ